MKSTDNVLQIDSPARPVGSNPGGTSKELSPESSPGRTAAIRSSRNVRTDPLAWSRPVTYHRPAWKTRPYASSPRSLAPPRQFVYAMVTVRRR